MGVIAALYTLLEQHIVYLTALLSLTQRRVMEKHDRLKPGLFGLLYRAAEPARLAQDYLFIGVLLGVKEPASRAANGDIADGVCVVKRIFSEVNSCFAKNSSAFFLVDHQ